MRTHKLAVPLLVLALLGAILASAALASTFVVEPEGEEEPYPAEIKGSVTGTDVIGFGEGIEISCKSEPLTGEETAASSKLELAPEFAECTQGGAGVTLTANGCHYVMNVGAEIGKTGKFSGTTNVVCPKGNDIEGTWGGGCKAHFGNESTGGTSVNQNLGTIEFENKAGPPADVVAKITLTGMYYDATVVGKTGCLNLAKGEHTNGTHNDTITLIGKVGAKTAPFKVKP